MCWDENLIATGCLESDDNVWDTMYGFQSVNDVELVLR